MCRCKAGRPERTGNIGVTKKPNQTIFKAQDFVTPVMTDSCHIKFRDGGAFFPCYGPSA